MIPSFRTDRSGQTVQTQIRLEEKSDQGLYCLQYRLHPLMQYSTVKPSCSNFRVVTANSLGVRIFKIFTVLYFLATINFIGIASSKTNPSFQYALNGVVWFTGPDLVELW